MDGGRGRRVMDVHVDELGAKRAAEGGSEIAGLHPEDHVRTVVVDLETLISNAPGWKLLDVG